MAWWWLWLVFVLVLFVVPLAYGWGYRGWGPPYPSLLRRRRTAAEGAEWHDPGWGVAADMVWAVLLGAIAWLLLALFWR